MATSTRVIPGEPANASHSHAYLGILAGLIAASFAAVFIRLAHNSGVDSVLIGPARLLLAAVILTPIVLRNYRDDLRRITRLELFLSVVTGFWGAVHFILMAVAFEYTTILIGQVIVNTSPLWVALLEMFVLKVKLPRAVWIGLMLALLGGGIIGVGNALQAGAAEAVYMTTPDGLLMQDTSAGSDSLLGAVFALLGAVTAAVYITMTRRIRTNISLIPCIWLIYSFGAVVGFIIVALTQTQVTGYSMEGYFWLIMLTLIPQLIGHSGFSYALGYLSATVVSISGQGISITSAIIAFFLFAEVPGIPDILGGAVIAAGVILAIMAQRRPKRMGG